MIIMMTMMMIMMILNQDYHVLASPSQKMQLTPGYDDHHDDYDDDHDDNHDDDHDDLE